MFPDGEAAEEVSSESTRRSFELAAGVRFFRLDDDAIVFNPFSWETHLLNPAAALVLDLAAVEPCTEAGIQDVLEEVLTEDERPRAGEHAKRLLEELVSMRLLVERSLETHAGR